MAFRGTRFGLLTARNLFASNAMKVALIGVALIPVIFAGFYLSAFLDPYSNLNNVPVAVVNEDEGAQIDGEFHNIAQEVCDKLEEEEERFGWNYVSEEEAEAGLKTGAYYMIVRFPADFSAQVASADSEYPEQAIMAVTYDKSHNILVGQLGQAAWNRLKIKVNQQIIEDYWGTVLGRTVDSAEDIQKAADGAKELADGLGDAIDGNGQITNGIEALRSGANQLTDGIAALKSGASQLDDGAQQLSDGMDSLASGSSRVNAGAQELNDKASALNALPDATEQLSSGSQGVADGIEQLQTGVDALGEGAAALKAGLAQASGKADDLKGAIDAGAGYVSDANDNVGEAISLLQNEESAAAQGALQYLQGAQQQLGGASQYLDGASNGAGQLSGALGEDGDLQKGAARIQAGAEQASTSIEEKLLPGAQAVADGNSQLNDTAQSSVPALTKGVSDLADGTSQLNAGISDAQSGANQLASNTPSLVDGAQQLQDGGSELSAGTNLLIAGSQALTEGLRSARDGSSELADGLQEGADEAYMSQSEVDGKSQMMSQPVDYSENYYTNVQNYGTGFAPFFLCLGIWVGCLFSGFLFESLNKRLLLSGANPFQVALVSFIPLMLFAFIQMLIAQLFVQFVLGSQINNVVGYYGIGLLTACTFTAIMQFLVAALGFVGRFVAVLLLTLQLTSSSGTFPVETSMALFQWLHPFMPMAYSTDALREVMTGFSSGAIYTDAAMLLLFAVVFFIGTAVVAYARRMVTMARLHPLLDI